MVENPTMVITPAITEESQPKSEWELFVEALDTFKEDYGIVGHPDTPRVGLFACPNGPDKNGKRQYSVTHIPPDMTESEVIDKLQQVNTVIMGCMDKDAIGPLHANLTQNGTKVTATLSMAGGIVQHTEECMIALETILTFVSKHGRNISTVVATGHNHTCGLVRVATNGEPLAKNLGVEAASPEEDFVMKQLIAHSANQYQLAEKFPQAQVHVGLVRIDREGNAELDTNLDDVTPLSIKDLAQQLQ